MTNYDKFLAKLTEIFQLDQADLDFGIYRIMNSKRDEIIRFLEKDLLPQVKAVLATAQGDIGTAGADELRQAEDAARTLGVNPDDSPKVREWRAKYAGGGDIWALEQEVFNHLYSFFRRYYDEGDFLSLRRYKEGIYAIPYEGEEVKLHWANADQYYIKTAEHFRDFTFKVGEKRVHFKLVEAQAERDNNKEQEKRVFILAEESPVVEENGELIIRFEYRNDFAKRKQKDLTEAAIATILEVAPQEWKAVLTTKAPTEKDPTRTILVKRLNDYTARNTFDYFIHKDLGGFLHRELDFYIKNEVMHLDDIEYEAAPKVEQYLAKVRAIRRVASKVIDFLAQLEEFQRRLWMKKKFVVATTYMVTVGNVPEALHPEVVANDAQWNEWTDLFGKDFSVSKDDRLDVLRKTPSLVLDTVHFSSRFVTQLLSSQSNLDSKLNGLLIEGDNLHALALLQARFQSSVRCTYIDPPYNTGDDGFMFKDAYKHSSWLSMMCPRLTLNRRLLKEDGVVFASIDSKERTNLDYAMVAIFGVENRVEELIWVQNTTKNQSPTYSTNHEYVEVFAKDCQVASKDPSTFRDPKTGYEDVQALIATLNRQFPTIEEAERKLKEAHRSNKKASKSDEQDELGLEDDNSDWKGLYNYTHADYRDKDGRYVDETQAREREASLWVWREDNPSMPQVKEDSQKKEFRDPDDPAFRFYKPVHPITGKPCPHPKRGWSWPFLPLGRQTSCFSELAKDHRIAWGQDETKIPQTKRFLHEVETNVAKSVVIDFKDGEKELANLFGRNRVFSNPKPTTLILRFAQQTTRNDDVVLDYFAGSGTTGQAVLNLNRKDGGTRKFILVEMGEHFHSVLVPRIKKCVFALDWKDGVPSLSATKSETPPGSGFIKVLKIESYDDSLSNLRLQGVGDSQAKLLEASDSIREDYMLRYLLDAETAFSPSMLNVQDLEHPFAYMLNVATDTVGETKEVNVDLVETFNWLLGLRVHTMDVIRGFHVVTGRLPGQGNSENGDKALIIWRDTTENSNAKLDEFFSKQAYNTLDQEFDVIYVNGDNNLQNLRKDDQTWKVRLIEEEFHRLMWDMGDI